MDASTGTPVYSELPATHDDPWAVIAAAHERSRVRFQRRFSHEEDELAARDSFPPLPWPLETLSGSHWRNLWTGHEVVAGQVVRRAPPATPWQQPLVLLRADLHYGGDPFLDACHIGLWWHGRYVVEHWVRVDHLPPAGQLAWYGVEAEYKRRELARYEDDLRRFLARGDRENRNSRRRDITYARATLDRLRGELRAFAEAHHLVVTPDLLNGVAAPDPIPAAPGDASAVGAAGNARPTQLLLFA